MVISLLLGCFCPACLVPEPKLASGKAAEKPLIEGIYTADPSAHVFEDKLYIYPSHDQDGRAPIGDDGSQFNMVDYHVFSLTDIDGPVTDHGVALHVDDVPWAERHMWAPDAAYKNGTYYLYFPARDKAGIFRIGAATAASPEGPFKAEPKPIEGSFSIDPCVFVDDDSAAYMIFGGLWGGQLEKWTTGDFIESGKPPGMLSPALGPRIAKMGEDMLSFSEPVREIRILDDDGEPVKAERSSRRFFEGAWMHKYRRKYYLSYSTGDAHTIVYAVGDSPYGPFTYQGTVLTPVIGWTTHHSIVQYRGEWYLFYHDASLSKGVDHQRSVKAAKLTFSSDGTIEPIDPR